jgi:hypothetical protein
MSEIQASNTQILAAFYYELKQKMKLCLQIRALEALWEWGAQTLRGEATRLPDRRPTLHTPRCNLHSHTRAVVIWLDR